MDIHKVLVETRQVIIKLIIITWCGHPYLQKQSILKPTEIITLIMYLVMVSTESLTDFADAGSG